MPCENKEIFVYQLRVWLRGISPAIWRRLLVCSDSNIADLHYTLQIAFGWTDFHLHEFVIRGKRYGVAKSGGTFFRDNPTKVQLGDFRFRLGERFVYEYDFRDSWEHEIRVEKHLPLDKNKTYPLCIGGARRSPPEECGGAWAFMQKRQHDSIGHIASRLAEILDSDDLEESIEDYREEVRKFQYWLNAERFSRCEVNCRFKQYAKGDQQWLKSLGEIIII